MKTKNFKIFSLAVFAVLLLSLTGCGKSGTPSSGDGIIGVDTTPPTLSITDDTEGTAGVTLVNKEWEANNVVFTFTFSESVTGFDSNDIIVTGGTKGAFSGSGSSYTLVVTPPTHSTTPIAISVAQDSAIDASGNGSSPSSTTQAVNTVKAYITTWDTAKSPYKSLSNSNQIMITANPSYSYNYNINWGDGNSDTGVIGDITHTYATEGVYTVEINGTFPANYFKEQWDNSSFSQVSDAPKLLSIDQWGTQPWKSMKEAFKGCNYMQGTFSDNPNLTNVTDMSSMFFSALAFNYDIGSWDVSTVTNMSRMFLGASVLNQDISNWDVSNVTNMSYMFYKAYAFNQPLNSWDVSNVTNMSDMFYNARAFNQPLNDWDVSSVTNMLRMFYAASSFNQPLNGWDVSNVTNMARLFSNASSFNQPLDNWDVSKVTSMGWMFYYATSFNQDISSWITPKVTTMAYMFYSASAFSNQDLSGWDVSSVTDHRDFMTEAGAGNTEPIWP